MSCFFLSQSGTSSKRIFFPDTDQIFWGSGLLYFCEDHSSAFQSTTNPYHWIYGENGEPEGLKTALLNMSKGGTKSLCCAAITMSLGT